MSLQYDFTKILKINDKSGDMKNIWEYASKHFGKSRFTAEDVKDLYEDPKFVSGVLDKMVTCYILRSWGAGGYGCKHDYDEVMNGTSKKTERVKPLHFAPKLPMSVRQKEAINAESHKEWTFWGGLIGGIFGAVSFIEFFVYPRFEGTGATRGDAFFLTLAGTDRNGEELDFLYFMFGSISLGVMLGVALSWWLRKTLNN